MTVTLQTQFVNAPGDSSLWLGVLKSTLSDEQFAAYEESCRIRSLRFIETAVSCPKSMRPRSYLKSNSKRYRKMRHLAAELKVD